MPPVTGKKIVLLGDSLSASSSSPGGQIAKHLTAHGAQVKIYAKVGRSARSFLREPDHQQQVQAIAAWQPDLAIVMLGTNDIGFSSTANRQAMAQVRLELASTGAQVWAIGPPAFAPGVRDGGQAVVDVMRDVFGPGRFMDLRRLTADLTASPGRAGDNIHFTAHGGAVVGQRVAQDFQAMGSGQAGVAVGIVTVLVLGWLLLR